MTWAQTINDLRGAPTMEEGQRALTRVYNSLIQRRASRAASQVVKVMNDFNGRLCEREADQTDLDLWAWGRQECYPRDQAIPQFLKDKLRRLSASLARADIPEAGALNPATDAEISDEIQTEIISAPTIALAGGGAIVALVVVVLIFLGLRA